MTLLTVSGIDRGVDQARAFVNSRRAVNSTTLIKGK